MISILLIIRNFAEINQKTSNFAKNKNMRKITHLSLLLLITYFTSCSSDESYKQSSEKPSIATPSDIKITSISSEFLYTGETLEITGSNFVNKDYPTKVYLSNIEISPKLLTNTTLQIDLPESLKTGGTELRIQIDKVVSPAVSFYIMAKGWNKIKTINERDIINSSVFEDSKTLFTFVDTETSTTSFFGQVVKLTPLKDGYREQRIGNNPPDCVGSFKMYNEKIGVITSTTRAFYSDDSFETYKKVGVEYEFSPFINGLEIGILEKNSSIITTIVGSQMYSPDNGHTVVKYQAPTWCVKVTANSARYRVNLSGFGKSISDNKFYQLGILHDSKKYGQQVYKNVVLESATGYGEWVVKDTVSTAKSSSLRYKFIDINKIYSINPENKTLIESNDQLKTWKVIKENVNKFFMRSATKWYIQSDNKILVTSDAGQTWNIELELPEGAVVNDISFSNKKIIVSGNKGLLYLKLE